MELRNCSRCGRLFASNGGELCPACLEELDEQYKVVREYVYTHPKATIPEVSDATGVEEKIIFEFLREGRLELKEPGLGLECERCGKPITTGRFCASCLRELERGLTDGLTPKVVAKKTKSEDKLFIADRINKRKE
ncbi:TIGR03826 family flagellar region protein [Mahella australiensis]|uniref:Flagellar operon protein YvyF n=1 Tax=Mahella australiensis (strain DSM 15567 / CIP 107919 / 50-1 BON) TaxID=697281 RepID=F3ZWA9_MAHA5|nr:TIGR03826 family flagellar region protein [Mahella australiensis]AEE97518.1 Flagellar operon protein YvyF [Mahella australiensis 50-1 BON]